MAGGIRLGEGVCRRLRRSLADVARHLLQRRFWFPHWLALAGLAVLAMGYLAVRVKPKGWRDAHLVAMLLSAYNLFGGAVNEAFLRVLPLREIPGPNILASLVVGMTHGVVMMTFTALIAFYVIASLLRGRSIHKSQFTIHKMP